MWEMKSKGVTPERWKRYLFDMLDYEGSLTSPKQLMVPINALPGPERRFDLPDAIARRAVQNKIAIASQALSVEDAPTDQSGHACAVDWSRHVPDTPTHLPFDSLN